MRPPKPYTGTAPFLSIWTPTFRRPKQLAACLASVGRQTVNDRECIQHLVLPDHVGHGVSGGLYMRLPRYADVLAQAEYVYFLADDDILAADDVVQLVQSFAVKKQFPDVILVKVHKGSLLLPLDPPGVPPVCGRIDLGSYIVRSDVWRKHVSDYGDRYEGDYDFALALHAHGYRHEYCDLLFAIGAASNGRPELDY